MHTTIWAKAINFGTNLDIFGQCLVEVLKPRILILRGEPPPQHRAFAKRVLQVALRVGALRMDKLVALSSAESELHAALRAFAETLGLIAMAKDWGYARVLRAGESF